MKRLASLILIMVLIVAVAVPGAMAAEKKAPAKKAPAAEKKADPAKGKQVTQCNWRSFLSRSLASPVSSRPLPVASSASRSFSTTPSRPPMDGIRTRRW